MATISLSDELIAVAKKYAALQSRSTPKQIEHWAKIGRIAEENPDLTYEFIEAVLEGIEEVRSGQTTPFVFSKP